MVCSCEVFYARTISVSTHGDVTVVRTEVESMKAATLETSIFGWGQRNQCKWPKHRILSTARRCPEGLWLTLAGESSVIAIWGIVNE
jgi:hypothetical protein